MPLITRASWGTNLGPPWEGRPGAQEGSGQIPSPLIRQPKRWSPELADLSRDRWTLPLAPRAAWEASPLWGGADGEPTRQSKLQYVLETLSARSLFVMSRRGAWTRGHPPSLPGFLPHGRIICRKLIFIGGGTVREGTLVIFVRI